MDNLTLEELNMIKTALMLTYTGKGPIFKRLIEKINQAIADKEFEEKKLNF